MSAYAAPPAAQGFDLDSPQVERARRTMGGQLQLRNSSKLEWFIADLETAQYMADGGDMTLIGQLARVTRRDGLISGLRKTRTAGLVSLPKKFHGADKITQQLQSVGLTRSLFDEMYPPDALALYLDDFIMCGVAVAELLPVKGRAHPMMVTRDPEFLRYRWAEDRWYYASAVGLLPITPGDGRWMLMTAARTSPWNYGAWPALGRAYISKEHAILGRQNYSRKLANPAIIGSTPAGATDPDRTSWMGKLVAWGYNTVFQVPPGWDVKILESNGNGWEVFGEEIETANLEIMVALAGSKVIVDGGTGFANAGIHAAIRADMIQENGAMLAHVINTQGLPTWVAAEHGLSALDEPPRVEWDVSPAQDVKAEAEGLTAVAKAITELKTALQGDRKLDVDSLVARFGIPSKALTAAEKQAAVDAAAAAAKPDAPRLDSPQS